MSDEEVIDLGTNALLDWDYYISMKERIEKLEELLSRVSNELHDPSGARWCDCPDTDRKWIESIRDFIDEEMGW